MRRLVVIGLAFVVLSAVLVPDALAAPNASVEDKVKKGKRVNIYVTNCYHGEDYTAYIDVTITRDDGTVVAESSVPSEAGDTGQDWLNFPMEEAGSYKVHVVCRHQFDGSTSGTWWEETEDLVVTEVTAKEKRKCNKKKTKKARKRCLASAAAD